MGVGRYEVIEEIGDGAMGRVWRGHDPLIGRAVAIKTVKSEYLTRDTRQEYLQRFRREARAAGLLSHPHIVSLYDVGEDFFVMELLDGAPLSDHMRRQGRLSLDEVVALLEPVADAIDYAHRAGVIHRDVKPGNIMVQRDGQPKLMDFGVARLETSLVTEPGRFFGSPSYMAPEQITSSHVAAQSDLYSLAVVAYEALTGARPFVGDSMTAIIYQVVNGTPAAPTSVVPELPGHLDAVFRRALAKRPGARFGTAGAFMAALKGEEFDPPELPPEPPFEAPAAHERPAALEPATTARGAETQDMARPRPAPAARVSALWQAAGLLVLLLVSATVLLVRGTRAAAPPAAAGALVVESDPSGAQVWVDGKAAGPSPVVVPSLSAGTHRVRVLLEGYAPAEVQLHVSEGMGTVPLRFALSGVTAPVVVAAGDGVTVRIDGRDVGRTPLDGPVHVPPGVHELTLERRGFISQRHALLARAGEPLRIEARLAPAPPAVAEPAPPAPTPAPPVVHALPAQTTVEMVEPPRPLQSEPARYPAAARRLQLEGSVLVQVTVESDGRAGDVLVLESAGAILDQAVTDAVRTWRFEPALSGGRPVPATWQYRQTFRVR
jgi:TonB family protein